MKIEVIDYDPEWAVKFEALSQELAEVVNADIISIEHVGSTSVVGLAAKPIIDLDIVVTRENVSSVILDLEKHGYKHRGDLGIEDREAFYNPYNPEGSAIDHHLYVCVEGALALRNHLFLRDNLRKDADTMNAYGSLKKDLAAKHAEDIDSYVEGKTQFILEILEGGNLNESELESIREVNRNVSESDTSKTSIRRLTLGEGQLYKETRLISLRDSPEAFSSSYEDALKRTEQSWVDQADSSAVGGDRATFIAVDERPVGLAAIYRDKNEPDVGELIQMWLAPEKRGGSTAHDLLDALFNWAFSSGFSRVKAEVESSNFRALRFYEKSGFSQSSDMVAHSSSSVMLTRRVEPEISKEIREESLSFGQSVSKASRSLMLLMPRGCVVSAVSESGEDSYNVEGQDFPANVLCQDLMLEIGSTSKIFTSLLLCIAIFEKKVSFDSTIGEFLPEPDRLHSSVRDITLRDLVTHTSGLPRDPEHPIETWDYYHNRDLIFSKEELFAQLYELPSVKRNSYYYSKFGVGDSAGYSNYGYSVLAEILALVYKGELHQVMRDRITLPLGLSDTVFPNELTESQKQRLLSSFCERAEMPAEKYDAMAGCGAILSTATDLIKFAKILQNPEGCALEDSIQLLKKKISGFDDLGVGIRTWKYHGEQIYEHGGMTYGCSCLFAFWEKQDRIAVILTSNTALPSWAILRQASGDKTKYSEGVSSESKT